MESNIIIKKLLKNLIIDLAIAAVALLIFAFSFSVLPTLTAAQSAEDTGEYLLVRNESVGSIDNNEALNNNEESKDFFSEETIFSDCLYTSKDIRVEVSTEQFENVDGNTVIYHVADIHVKDIECFKTAIANDTFQYFGSESMRSMESRVNAICAMSGDYLTFNSNNIIVRNGRLIKDSSKIWGSMCVLYYDGTIECYDTASDIELSQIKEANPWQTWSFGPILLDEDGEVIQKYDMVSNILGRNPRAALGYYEPGHYCFVVVEGRSDKSAGALLPEVGQIFKELGCEKAYNLDGGGSAGMTFNHEIYSKQSDPNRELGDILYIAEVVE